MQLTSLIRNALPALAVACGALLGTSASHAASPAASPAAPRSFKVAAVAFDPAWGDLEGNISRMVAGLEEVARQGVRLAVLPEQATIGYIFDDFAMVKPYLDTVPGKARSAIEKVTRAHRMYVVVGIAERDVETGLGYNTVALIGPAGYIGKYRKHGLNAQDQRWVSVGDLGFPVFDTELGRITMLICYDDTYWQYGRLALLHDVDIIAWASASDRVIPGTPPDQAKGDHSTVANVQYLSAHSGAFVVAATRNGIEENPLNKQRLYYNGGSSIWDPNSHKLAQAAVLPPEVLPSGVHGVAIAQIEPAKSAPVRAALLARRRPEFYGLLALHRAPTDANATTTSHRVEVAVEGGDPAAPATAWSPPPRDGLAVLPALFRHGPDHPPGDFARIAEPQSGPSETALTDLTRQGGGYVAGSYPERDGNAVYHTSPRPPARSWRAIGRPALIRTQHGRRQAIGSWSRRRRSAGLRWRWARNSPCPKPSGSIRPCAPISSPHHPGTGAARCWRSIRSCSTRHTRPTLRSRPMQPHSSANSGRRRRIRRHCCSAPNP
jgi:predicted amidohydrolase